MKTLQTPSIHQHSFRAMGCQMSIWLEHANPDEAQDALHSAEDLFATAEERLSRFLPDSELSQLNAQAGQWVNVSRVLWQILVRAQQLAQETDGLFDPTLLDALELAGYRESFSTRASQESSVLSETIERSISLHGRWQEIEFDATRHAVRLPNDVKVDLGGIAKGSTAQAAVDFLSHWGPCLVDAGGDLTAGDAPHGLSGWPISIAAPSQAENDDPPSLLQLWLVHGTVATSGIDYRCWSSGGKVAHHIIDPRTGAPAQSDALTVTVLSSNAEQAEAWATAGLIAGLAQGMQLFEEHNLAAALVDANSSVQQTSHLTRFIFAQ